MTRVFLFAVALVACGSGSGSPPIDSKMGGTLGFGSDCTVVSNMSTECASGVCTNTFNMFPTPVCSVQCTMLMGSGSATGCPLGSMGQKCNEQGYCRP